MKTTIWVGAAAVALVLAAAYPLPARADFELADAKGKRILLKDDGTWQYKNALASSSAASEPAKEQPQADLLLERRIEAPGGCRFEMVLVNTLPYAIRNLVPEFAVFRANGVEYRALTAGFGPVRPGDKGRRTVQFEGIACSDVAKIQVRGGDRCDMGDLQKFSEAVGECLARVRVQPSKLLAFEKLSPDISSTSHDSKP
ncbi:MAG: hypothetical protein Q7T97_05875 [Burkholderiaceae bacterium]|nr:hypothetical protein [Burkholderiaceae bacterium]